MAEKLFWGIDLGGTKTEIVVVKEGDLSSKEEIEKATLIRTRLATEQAGGYEHVLSRIKKLLLQAENEIGKKCEHLGICTPGSINPRNDLMRNANLNALNNKPLKADLEKTLGCPTRIANDADCLALAEAMAQPLVLPGEREANASLDKRTVFGIIMGTGVGGGIVIGGKLLRGAMGIAGEWGHNPLDESGGKCYCGKVGCVEMLIAGPRVEDSYEKFSEKKEEKRVDLREIYKRFKAGDDQAAKKALDRLCFFFWKSFGGSYQYLRSGYCRIGRGTWEY